MSCIIGEGFGSSHDWQIVKFAGGKNPASIYSCSKCKCIFSHFYHKIPDIFEAIKHSGLKDRCDTIQKPGEDCRLTTK